MKAAFCDRPGAALDIREVPVPSPSAGQYLVRVEACGICHSDLHLQLGEEPLPDDVFPLCLGHEGVGRIVAGGGPLPIGTRVALPWLYSADPASDPTLRGKENYCPHQKARGIDAPGAFAEYALLETEFAVEIPDAIATDAAGPLLCAGLTAWSALGRCDIQPGQRLLIVGAGGLGQYAISIGLARGLAVAVVDPDPRKRREALRQGAGIAIGPDDPAAIRAWGGADVVVNFAPTATVWELITGVVNPLSQIVLVALVQEPVPLSAMWLINGGHRVMGSSVGTRADLRDYLHFAAEHPPSVAIDVLPFAQVNQGLERLAAGDVTGRLVLRFEVSVEPSSGGLSEE
ncbi:alcohol dehydrogenase catalytic domain-containing protein [Litorisediminicola beolgyonensis]|uniref:alcohol dehydrogenase n=1 Tax=Litorisediminicola beolgyonensis TaxID=1173614 RepID=A0ABW3ZJ16_9RHOB